MTGRARGAAGGPAAVTWNPGIQQVRRITLSNNQPNLPRTLILGRSYYRHLSVYIILRNTPPSLFEGLFIHPRLSPHSIILRICKYDFYAPSKIGLNLRASL